jgi:hypothetical protein
MGMYSEVIKCDLSVKYVFAVANEFGLPTPRECHPNDHCMEMRLRDVRPWLDAAEDATDVHLFYIARLMHEHCQAYISKVGREASGIPYGRKRLKYFQRASKRYRLLFL